MISEKGKLLEVVEKAIDYLTEVKSLPIGINESKQELINKIDTTLPENGEDFTTALEKLSSGAKDGLIGNRTHREQKPKIFWICTCWNNPNSFGSRLAYFDLESECSSF